MRAALMCSAFAVLSACNSTTDVLSAGSIPSSSGSTTISDTTQDGTGGTTSSNTLLSRAPTPDPFEGLLTTARAAISLNPLRPEDRLTSAAQGHAEDMSSNGYFSHTDLDGGSVSDRVTSTGYDWCWVGENIAYGYTTQTNVFNAWMDSPGHRANMLSASPTEFGLGHASSGNYWVMVLAAPGC